MASGGQVYESGTSGRLQGGSPGAAGGVRAGALVSLGLLALLAAQPARAEPSTCRLQVGVEPRTLDADHPRARVRVVTAGPTPRLVSSAGEIQEVRRVGATTFVADYVPPAAAVPRAAVIAATLDDGSCGMGTVRIAGAEPQADPPARPAIAVVFLPQFVEADQDAKVLAYLFAADDDGNPSAGAPPALEVGLGEVAAAEPMGRGVWRARWHVPPRTTPGAALKVSFEGGAAAMATLTGVLASLEVMLTPGRVVPGNPEPVAITVRAWDATHGPTDANLSVSSEAGDLGELVRVERGVYRSRLTMPAGLKGSGVINVQARAGPIVGEAPLSFAPGAPAVVVVGGPDSVPGDGSGTRLLSVDVADDRGNPVDDVQPTVEAHNATVGVPSRVGPGSWMVPYRPRRVSSEVDDLVVAHAGSVSGQRALLLVVPVNRFAVGPKVGVAFQSGGSSLAAGAEASAWTLMGRQQLGLALDASYWSLKSSGTLAGLGGARYSNERSYFPVVLSAAWRRPMRGSMMTWASIGGGAARVSATNRLSTQQAVVDSAWVPAASGAVSLGLWAWNGFSFAELRGTWTGDPGLPTLRGSLFSVLLQLGYRFHAE